MLTVAQMLILGAAVTLSVGLTLCLMHLCKPPHGEVLDLY